MVEKYNLAQCFLNIFCKCPHQCRVDGDIISLQSVGYSKTGKLPLPQFPCLHNNAKMIFLAPKEAKTVIIRCL